MISRNEERLLTGFAERYIQSDAPMTIQIWNRMVLGIIIRELKEGRTPSIPNELISEVTINFQDSENLVYVFFDINLLEEHTVVVPPTHPTQPYRPMFLVDMSDPWDRMYVRTGEHLHEVIHSRPGYSFETLQPVVTGRLITTTQNIYYASGRHTTRISYKEIIGVTPLDDESVVVTLESGEYHIFTNLNGELATYMIMMLVRRA